MPLSPAHPPPEDSHNARRADTEQRRPSFGRYARAEGHQALHQPEALRHRRVALRHARRDRSDGEGGHRGTGPRQPLQGGPHQRHARPDHLRGGEEDLQDEPADAEGPHPPRRRARRADRGGHPGGAAWPGRGRPPGRRTARTDHHQDRSADDGPRQGAGRRLARVGGSVPEARGRAGPHGRGEHGLVLRPAARPPPAERPHRRAREEAEGPRAAVTEWRRGTSPRPYEGSEVGRGFIPRRRISASRYATVRTAAGARSSSSSASAANACAPLDAGAYSKTVSPWLCASSTLTDHPKIVPETAAGKRSRSLPRIS